MLSAPTLVIPFVFALAAVCEALTIVWHMHRESEDAGRAALVGMLLELLSWIPIWLAITSSDLRVVAASIAGSGIGVYVTLRRSSRDRSHTVL